MFDIIDIVGRAVIILLLALLGALFSYMAHCAELEGIVVLPILLGFVAGCCFGGICIAIYETILDVINSRK